MKTKTLLWSLVFFLIAGIYIDVRMMDKDESICIKDYRQRQLVIQTVVPFKPDRETLYLGIGNRHHEHEYYIHHYLDENTGEYLGTQDNHGGCWQAYQQRLDKGGHSLINYESGYHYINLNWLPIQEQTRIDTTIDYKHYLTKEEYIKYYGDN